MAYEIGEMYVLQERYGDHSAGEIAFCLGNNRFTFMSENFTDYLPYAVFAKVKFSDKLEGKSVCFTGKLDHPRDYYKKIVEFNGGKIANTVTKDLSYLVVSKDFLEDEKLGYPSTKLKKARAQKITVLTFKDFLQIIK